MFKTLKTALVAGALLCAPAAWAQDLGLDLSDGPDLRPTLAVLGIGIPTTADAAQKARADKLTTALVAASRKTNWFSKVMDPAECAAKLGDGAGAALHCETADCLVDLARQLGVDRVLASQMEFPADGPNLKLLAIDAGVGASSLDVVDVLAQGKSAGFERSVAGAFKPLLQKFSTLLGTLKVVPSDPAATVEVGGRLLGVGTVEKRVAAGSLKVRVTLPDHHAFETEVTLEPKGSATVEAKLEKKLLVAPQLGDAPPLEATRPAAPSTPIFKRGGLYVAVVGLAAVGTGVFFAMRANDIKSKAADANNDGIVDVSRWQRNQAIKDAQLGNILMGAGGGVALGGALWFIFEPAPSMPGKEGKEPGGPKTEPTPVGFLFKIGGEI
ncbi:MAG: PEGA domain-containing protein [Myxococcales bacterium]